MSKPPEPGKQAQYNYQQVIYSHVSVDPGASLLLTADPWSFLNAFLSKQLATARGDRKLCLERAAFYAELAEGFYSAADKTTLPTRATLVYYGMLNLVKCFLSTNRVELESTVEHHGITLPMGSETIVRVQSNSTSATNIFHEFSRLLGTPVTGTVDLELKEIAAHIPEIHEIAFSLGHVGAKRHFLPIRIDFLVNKSHNRAFTELRYEKKNEARVRFQSLYSGARAEYFKDLGERDGWHVFRSNGKKVVDKTKWPRAYRTILREYSKFNLVSLLAHDGYRYYCDLGNPLFNHLSYSLLLAFYTGTIARYRPRATQSIMRSDLRPLIGEAMAVCPRQFLYQMTSKISGSVCSVPHASLA